MRKRTFFDFYNKDYFRSEFRDLKSPRLLHHGSAYILKDILKGKEVILDLGCGIGVLSNFLVERGGRVWGVDGSKYAISKAKKRYGRENLDFKVLDLEKEKLVFPNKFFDGIICVHVLEHLKNLDFVFKEIERVLKNDGVAVFEVPNCGFGVRSLSLRFFYGLVFGRSDDKTHRHSFTTVSLRELLEQYFPRVEIFTYPAFLIWLFSPWLAKRLSFSWGNNIFAVCKF